MLFRSRSDSRPCLKSSTLHSRRNAHCSPFRARSNSRCFAEQKLICRGCRPLSSGLRPNKVRHVGELVSKVQKPVYRNINGQVLVLGIEEAGNSRKEGGLAQCVFRPPLAPIGRIGSVTSASDLAQSLIRPISSVGIERGIFAKTHQRRHRFQPLLFRQHA